MRRGTEAAVQFGAVLKEIRTRKGLTMRAVGAGIGAPAATVSQVETAQRAVKEDKIDLWADALGVSKGQLRKQWHAANAIPAPPIVRKRRYAPKAKTLVEVIEDLTSVERARVLGYIDSLIEGRE